jgi:hypothetical protein
VDDEANPLPPDEITILKTLNKLSNRPSIGDCALFAPTAILEAVCEKPGNWVTAALEAGTGTLAGLAFNTVIPGVRFKGVLLLDMARSPPHFSHDSAVTLVG